MTADLFDGYAPEEFFDEIFTPDGAVRPHYDDLVARLRSFTSAELARREHLRDTAFRSAGITFTVYGEDEGVERTFPMDLLPRIIPAEEWAQIEKGLVQRVTALNRFLDDLYVGERAAVRDGIERATPRADVLWQTEQLTRWWRPWSNRIPKLRSGGKAFIAPVCAFVWQIVQMGLELSENWRA